MTNHLKGEVVRCTAKEILTKLRVRPGLQMTTYVYSSTPYVYVDFYYERSTKQFALRVSWPGRNKIVYLNETDVLSPSKKMWMADKTFRLSEECVARIAPGLDALLVKVVEAMRSSGE